LSFLSAGCSIIFCIRGLLNALFMGSDEDGMDSSRTCNYSKGIIISVQFGTI
jgi:hypothetical protein